MFEYDDQPGGDLKKGFIPVGAERTQIIEPFLRHPSRVAFIFFGLRSFTDAAFKAGIGDGAERPRLFVCA